MFYSVNQYGDMDVRDLRGYRTHGYRAITAPEARKLVKDAEYVYIHCDLDGHVLQPPAWLKRALEDGGFVAGETGRDPKNFAPLVYSRSL